MRHATHVVRAATLWASTVDARVGASVQRRHDVTPVIYQAATSTRGRDFAASHAEAIFLGGGGVDAVRESIT